MKKYGVMVIGCGHIGCRHLDFISKREDVRLVCVVDSCETTAKQTAEKYNAENYSADYKDYLSKKDIDIVIIATYASSHIQILADCLKNNKHILCEKPLGICETDGEKFLSLTKNSANKVLVSLVLRHDPTYIKMKQLIDEGLIGDIRTIRIVQNQQVPENNRTFNLLEDCTPVLDAGIHYIDIVKWFTGSKLLNLDCKGTKDEKNYPRENHTILTFALENGGMGYIETGWDKSVIPERKVEFIGSKGRMEVVTESFGGKKSSLGNKILVFDAEKNRETEYFPDSKENAFSLQFTELIDMIEGKKVGSPTSEEVYSSYKTALEAQNMLK